METQIIKDMWKVDELIYSFRNVLCLDDNKELEDYSNKNSIAYIMSKKNIIIAQKKFDLTYVVLKILDSKVKKIKLK